MVDQGILLLAIARPGRVAFEDAVQLGLAALRLEPLFDVRVLHTLTDPGRERPPESEETIWVLDLVERLLRPESRALIALLPFMKDPDAVVRSKAVRLIARLQKNEAWFLEAIHDPDPRVRANLLEAVAGESNRHPGYVWKLLEMAAADSNYRPAVAALFFMARAGDESAQERLRSMSQHGRETDPARNAAAMALAKLGTAIAQAASPDSEPTLPHSEPEPTSLPGR